MADFINTFVSEWGYLALAVLMFVENVFPPIPSELIMPLGGYFASRGGLDLWLVIVSGVVGSVVGQLPLYAAGKVVGKESFLSWTEKYGKYIFLRKGDVEKASKWFDNHGKVTVFLGRMVPGIRSLVSLPAGFVGMNFWQFLLYSLAGITIWTTLLTVAGYYLQDAHHQVEQYLGPVSYVVIGILVLGLVGYLVKRKK